MLVLDNKSTSNVVSERKLDVQREVRRTDVLVKHIFSEIQISCSMNCSVASSQQFKQFAFKAKGTIDKKINKYNV